MSSAAEMPLPATSPSGDPEVAAVELEEVVVVAGHAPRRAAHAVALEARGPRDLLRKEPRLDLLGDPHVALEALLRGLPLALDATS